MSVSVLIMSHDGIGPALLGTTTLMMEDCPIQVKLLSTSKDSDPDEIMDHAREILLELDSGDGVLILTDMFGSTPSNVAQKLSLKFNVNIVSGLNLSMLIRVMNYPELPLEELTQKAISGGKEGVVQLDTLE